MALTEQGLVIRRQPEVVEDLVAAEQANIHPDINTEESTLLGQLNSIISLAIADQEALAESVNDNFSVLYAEGISLDRLAANIGASRIEGVKTSGVQHFVGDNGTTVLEGVVLENPNTQDRFVVNQSVTLDTTNCLSTDLEVTNLVSNEVYNIDVVGISSVGSYQYESDSDATAIEIVTALKDLIDADVDATWSATVTDEVLMVESDDLNTLAISVTTYMSPSNIKVSGSVTAEEEGSIVAPANSVIGIVSAPSGLRSTFNPNTLAIGRSKETDEELRSRILVSQQISSVATVEAIKDRLRNTTGVEAATVVENDSNVTDGAGRPAKSFESIVQSGLDADVAQTTWLTKPAGIATYGTSAVVINDSDGNQQTINFTRPSAVNLAFEVEYTKHNDESFPLGGETAIRAAIVAYTKDLGVDADVIPSRYFGTIYNAVEGVDDLLVKVQVIASSSDAPNPANWQTTRLPISIVQFANTEAVDVTILEV